jgi:hypothetical protein
LGQKLSCFGWQVEWEHSTRHWNWKLEYEDFAPGFQADVGFVPQVGYREGSADLGYRIFPTGFFSRLNFLAGANHATARDGTLISRRAFPGVIFQGKGGLRGEIDYNFEAVRIDGTTLPFDRLVWNVSASPSRLLPLLGFQGDYGEQPDVSNVRVGTGGTLRLNALLRPNEHLGVELLAEREWIDETVDGRAGRLFAALVARVKAVYVFNARMLIRLIGQYVETTRDPTLWTFPVLAKDGGFAGSALFSYKLNWQTVLFLGYGDNRTLEENGALTRADRQFFLKVSYAFQR